MIFELWIHGRQYSKRADDSFKKSGRYVLNMYNEKTFGKTVFTTNSGEALRIFLDTNGLDYHKLTSVKCYTTTDPVHIGETYSLWRVFLNSGNIIVA